MSTVCVWALGVVFAAGATPGLFAQAELAEPGLQVVGEGRELAYGLAAATHALIFSALLPVVGFALAAAVIGEAKTMPVFRWGAVALLVAAPLFAIAVGMGLFSDMPRLGPWWAAFVTPQLLLPVQAAIGLAALILIALLVPECSDVARNLALLSGLALAVSVLMNINLASSGVDRWLHDTYFAVAANHASGVCVVLNIFGVLIAWCVRLKRMAAGRFGLIAGACVLVAGELAVFSASALGLRGMPRAYMDYPSAFAPLQSSLAMWSMIFAATTVAAVTWLAVMTWRAKPPPGVEAVFD